MILRRGIFCLLLVAGFIAVNSSRGVAQNAIREAIEKDYDANLGPLFIYFHSHPELSFLETNTAARMAKELRDAGVEVTEHVGGTGVVGVIKNGAGPTVLIRADMDALPVKEMSGLPYASTVTQVNRTSQTVPVMHACGHDVHITSLVGTAHRLMALKDQWQGTVVLVVQPAEEIGGGAEAMIKDGLYTRFPKPNYALGLHVASFVPSGKLLVRTGQFSSSVDSVDLTIHGVGAHGAAPHKGKDPIVLSAEIIMALQTLVSREISPLEPGVVTVGSIHGGLKHNVISDKVEMQITVRADTQEVRDKLLAGIKRISENAGRMAGLPENLLPEMKLAESETKPVFNTPELTDRLRKTFTKEFGDERMFMMPRDTMGGEDFSEYIVPELGVPGCYFNVGGTPQSAFDAEKKGGPAVPSHHSALFKIEPKPAVTTGVEAMTVAVLDLLGKAGK